MTREQLHELVWTEPMWTLSERFGMSDRGLAKLCERHAIPVPARGYWRRKETGHSVRRLALPKLHANHARLASVQLPAARVIVTPRAKPEVPPDPPRVAAQKEFEEAHPIVVGDLPVKPHALVRATRAGLRRLKDGTTNPMRPDGASSLDLYVTAATRERGLCILEALCQAFKQRGFPVAARQGDRRNSQIEVHGVKIAFSLEERLRQQERPKAKPLDRLLGAYSNLQDRYMYLPTGELVLKAWHNAGSKSKWTDGKRHRVEDKLNDFMIAVVTIADNHIRWKEERVVYERKRAEEERLRWERQQHQAEEARRGKDFAELAGRWHEVETLRAFVAALRSQLASSKEIPSDSQLERWLQWADGYADQLDPLKRIDRLPPPYIPRLLWDSGPVAKRPIQTSVANTVESGAPPDWSEEESL